MKKFICILLSIFMLFLTISFSIADETEETEKDWFYPFGFSDESTYDEIVSALLEMFPADEKLIFEKEDSITFFPDNSELFDTPLMGCVVKRYGDNGFKYIMLQLEDEYDVMGVVHFLDAIEFLNDNCKTDVIKIEPSKVSYDLNGNPYIVSFLNDIDSFGSDYFDRDKAMDCLVSWHEAQIQLKKDYTSYSISIIFFSRYAMEEDEH